ncbi:MAG: cytochrome c maturation protein CcmE [Neomegalonema sp.]|nr:cytochrome c maturation protein CcmE [Neomegalonema sp.]
MTAEADAPRPAGRLVGARRRRRTRLIIFSAVLFVAAAALVLSLVGLDRFMLPSDFHERYAAGKIDKTDLLRIGGFVEKGSVKHGEGAEIRFVITDSIKTVPVVYKGVLPPLFKPGEGVVADGKWEGDGKDGLLRAERVLAKHDENYTPPQLKEALKDRGIKVDGK